MAIKEENEITIRVICSDEKLRNILLEKGFKADRNFSLDDYYLIPKNLDVDKLTTREILEKAVIIRVWINEGKITQMILLKKKDISETGEIISQKSFGCNIYDCKEAIKLFEELGYYEIMNIKENSIVYSKDKLELAVKFIENSNTLIEIETDENFRTVEELKWLVEEINLPIEKDNYFVKKAEEALNKILKR